jgi:hypothetical protein
MRRRARTVEFDVIDLGSVRSMDFVGGERLANGPGVIDERREMGSINDQGVIFDQEKPVATPGNVAGDRTVSGDVYFDCCCISVAGNVFDGHGAIFVEHRSHDADRRFDTMVAGFDLSHVGEGDHNTDGSVSTHAKASAVVEEDGAGYAICVAGLAEQGADHRLRATWLGDQSAAKSFMIFLKQAPPFDQVTFAQIGCTFDDGAGGLTAGV